MSFFDGLLGPVLGIVGNAIAPGIGGVIGGVVGGALSSRDESGGSSDFSANPTGSDFTSAGSAFGRVLGQGVGGGIQQVVSGQQASEAIREQNEFNVAAASRQMDFQREMSGRSEAFQRSQSGFQADFGREAMAEQWTRQLYSQERQMDFQERMSNTANQRVVADLQAAGLNPMLAYSRGGASTPAGGSTSPGMASVSAGSGSYGSGASPGHLESPKLAALNSAAALAKVGAEIDYIRANTDVAKSQQLINAVQVPRIEQETRTSAASAGELKAKETDIYERLRVLMPEEHAKIVSQTFLNNAHSNFTMEQWRHEFEKTKLTKAEVQLALLEIPRARNIANAQDSYWMEKVSPYLPDAARSIGSAYFLRRAAGR